MIRYSDVMGDGVYISKDAGKTWKHMGLARPAASRASSSIPTNPNIVYVCATGPADRSAGRARRVQDDRRRHRTGSVCLFVDRNTGCSGLSMDAKDPNTLLAGHLAGRAAHVGCS